MTERDDDVSTIVLDFNNLKSKLDEKEDIIEDEATMIGLEFSTRVDTSVESTGTSLQALNPSKKIYLFTYKTTFFSNQSALFGHLENCHEIKDIKELNSSITENPDSVFLMYFNDTPKAINQISEQIKRKFKNAKSIIIARNLSKAKAEQHASSKYGADAYLNEPFSAEELEETLKKVF